MTIIGYCPICFNPIYNQNKLMYFHITSWIEVYVAIGCKPLGVEYYSIGDLSEEFRILEEQGFIVTHEDNEGILIKPLGLNIEKDNLHWFCLKNHLQDDERDSR